MRTWPARWRTLVFAAVAILAVFVTTSPALAFQWGPRRTVGLGQTSDHSLAVSGNRAYVIYDDYDANGAISYRRSTDGGDHWSLARTIQSTGARSYAIAASGSTVIVLLTGQTSQGDWRVWIRRSTDGGQTWKARMALADGTTFGGDKADVAIAGSIAIVAWTDPVTGEILVRRSADGGAHWALARTIGHTKDINVIGDFEGYVSVAAASGRAYVLWVPGHTTTSDGISIRMRRSLDGGTHWKPATRIVAGPITSEQSIHSVASGSRLLVTYTPTVGTLSTVSSVDSGATMRAADIATSTSSSWSGVALLGGNARAIFTLASGAIYMRRSSDGGRTWHESGTVDVPSGTDASLSLGMGTNGVVATWYESPDPPSAGGFISSRHGS